jgi:SAM-dependent methyltransferase
MTSKKLHIGCGRNKLNGWLNHDTDMDIRRPLPLADNCLEHIFAEHVLEHVTPREAWGFLKEAHRVLQPGGGLRIVVPCVDLIYQRYDHQYANFMRRIAHNDGSLEASIRSVIFNWGHMAIWTTGALQAVLGAIGYKTTLATPGNSHFPSLAGVDGHAKAIGEHANWVESGVVEAVKWSSFLPDGTKVFPEWGPLTSPHEGRAAETQLPAPVHNQPAPQAGLAT